MKRSQVSGKTIYGALSKLYKELDELYEACEIVKADIGQSSTAYKILKKSYDEKQQEIKQHENELYTFLYEKEGF